MTHRLTMPGNINEYFAAETLGGSEYHGAGDIAGSSLATTPWSLPTETVVAWMSLLMIVALIVAHSGYWALLLPSWLALVFMVGATAPARDNRMRSAAQGGSH